MSPDEKTHKLLQIADELSSARLLVEASHMAIESLEKDVAGPLSELLCEIVGRLRRLGKDLEKVREAA